MIYKPHVINGFTNLKIFSASKQLLNTIQENLPADSTKQDPMIARGLEVWQYVGIIALFVSLVVLVRVFSLRVEHAILFAIFLSVILIVIFVTI